MGRSFQQAGAGRTSLQRTSGGPYTVDALTRGESNDIHLQSSTK